MIRRDCKQRWRKGRFEEQKVVAENGKHKLKIADLLVVVLYGGVCSCGFAD